MEKVEYLYRGKVVGVYDGDTITVDFDLGFYVTLRNQTIRLARIDAPELKGQDKLKGQAVRDWLRRLLLGKTVTIQTFADKKETYGRWLGEVWLERENVNDMLLEGDMAEIYGS